MGTRCGGAGEGAVGAQGGRVIANQSADLWQFMAPRVDACGVLLFGMSAVLAYMPN